MVVDKFGNKLKAAIPIHEGEILKDELVARKMSQKEFAVRIGYSYSTVNKVCNQKARMPYQMCISLQYVLGVDSQFWLNLKRNYDEWFK